jgi:hypothetical protein
LTQINEKFAEAERRLRRLQPVTNVWLIYRSEPADPYQPDSGEEINHCIGVVKHDGIWRLCHGVYRDDSPLNEPAEWEPISETSRWVRVEVASDFPKMYRNLEEEIVKNTEHFVPKAQQALAKMMVALGEI